MTVLDRTATFAALPPVWCLGPESRFPGLGYVAPPGNVGNDSALSDLVASLSAR